MTQPSPLQRHLSSPFAGVALITLTTMIVSIVVAQFFASAMDHPTNWQHYVFAIGVPAITTPLWAVPVVRANRQLARMRSELERLAKTDALCGLPNRRAFFEKAGHIIANSGAQPVVAMMIDVDLFKRINDTFGHDAGDAVLRQIGTRIDETVAAAAGPDRAVTARVGGEEFAVLVGKTSEDRGFALAESIRRAVGDKACMHCGRPIPVTISIGLALRTRDEPVDEVLKSADLAVYEAKRAGRNRCELFRGEARRSQAA